MAIESQGAPGLDYDAFRKRVDGETFTGQQIAPLKLRLDLLESFIDRHSKTADSAWDFEPGTLTIVDLSCPFVDESSACALFSICLDLFLEHRNTAGRIVALDEAHKVKKRFQHHSSR